MRPTLRDWANRIYLRNTAASFAALWTLAAFFLLGKLAVPSFAEMPELDSFVTKNELLDSIPLVKEDSLLQELAPVKEDSLLRELDSVKEDSLLQEFAPVKEDSLLQELAPVKEDSLPQEFAPVKNVLYLGGGEHSPWFHLGVLYAIEEFSIPVDSIVATSWGAWIGALWAKGVAPDEIQRIMLDPDIAPYVGKNLLSESEPRENVAEIPFSKDGIPSLRKRASVMRSQNGNLSLKWRDLSFDSMEQRKNFARLRFQESLYRQSVTNLIPFSLQSCDQNALAELRPSTVDEIVKSLPLENSENNSEISGELCPFYALPAEDDSKELAIIVVATPLRNPSLGDAKIQLLQKAASAHLANQPGLIVRAHSISDTSRNAWIQAGFSAMESRRTSYGELSSRKVDYGEKRGPAKKPWFRFIPALDSLSPAVHGAVQSYWVPSDTGMSGPKNFANRIQENPSYDSLKVSMTPGGELLIETATHPTLDFAVGGFGSNVFGPNAYAEGVLRYVDHVEMALTLAGFWGGTSYGFTPKLEVSKLWGLRWGIALGFDFMRLQPLRSFSNEIDENLKFKHEERYDLNLMMYYDLDDHQRLSAEFLFGERLFALDSLYFWNEEIKTHPVSPMLHYSYRNGESGWFAKEGLQFNAMLGLQSISYNLGIIDLIPIYWKVLLDASYALAPKSWLSLSAGAVAGTERYHEDGFGYVYPKSFDNAPLDLVYRLHAQPTPWFREWYDPELSSHEYAMFKASASVHGKFVGAWLFAAYYHDFEESPLATLDKNKFVFEPALRIEYKSVKIYMGLNRIVDSDSFGDLLHLSGYNYFIRIGDYEF